MKTKVTTPAKRNWGGWWGEVGWGRKERGVLRKFPLPKRKRHDGDENGRKNRSGERYPEVNKCRCE